MKTVLYDEHLKLGGKIVDFAGWDMPLWYPKGHLAEHNATRETAGLFDICHMGEFFVEGKDSEDFFSNLLTNNIKGMTDGQAMYNFMLNEMGGVIDDCIVYKFNSEKWMLVVNAGNIDVDFEWLKKNAKGDVKVDNASDRIAKLDLQGPSAPKTIVKLGGMEVVEGLKFFTFKEKVNLNGIEVLLSRTGYTGEIGFEIYADMNKAAELWNMLLEAGKEFGVEACGLAARDSLRTEAGLPLHGHEISPEIPALGTPWGFVFDWEHDFNGKANLLKVQEEGKGTFVYGFIMEGKAKAMPEWNVLKDGEVIGQVVSGVTSPTLDKKPIGFLRSNVELELDTQIEFNKEGSKRVLTGVVAKTPFVKPTSRRKMKSFL